MSWLAYTLCEPHPSGSLSANGTQLKPGVSETGVDLYCRFKIFVCVGKFAVPLGLEAFLVRSSGIFRCFVGGGAQRHAFNLCSSPHHNSAHVNAAAERIEVHKADDTGAKTRSRGPQLTIRQLAS